MRGREGGGKASEGRARVPPHLANDLANGQAMVCGKGMVTIIVCWYTHDSATAIGG